MPTTIERHSRTGGRPIERAAHYDGIFPLGLATGLTVGEVSRIADTVATIRGGSRLAAFTAGAASSAKTIARGKHASNTMKTFT